MKEKHGFTQFSIEEFEEWIRKKKIGRTILTIQQHHTFRPAYAQFSGDNHLKLQKGMADFHIHSNGWRDIGQHLSIFPDGDVVTGRSFEISPACIRRNNGHAFCIENIGDFDQGKDEMTAEQRESILRVTAVLCKKFGLKADSNTIVYHHWFDLDTGQRKNGERGKNKSCPGTAFFGGNKVADFAANFLPALQPFLDDTPIGTDTSVEKYACVKSGNLNVRTGPHFQRKLAGDPLKQFAIVRVYEQSDNNWFKISKSETRWVSGKYTYQVYRAKIMADHILNGKYVCDQEVFVTKHPSIADRYIVNLTEDVVSGTDLALQA